VIRYAARPMHWQFDVDGHVVRLASGALRRPGVLNVDGDPVDDDPLIDFLPGPYIWTTMIEKGNGIPAVLEVVGSLDRLAQPAYAAFLDGVQVAECHSFLLSTPAAIDWSARELIEMEPPLKWFLRNGLLAAASSTCFAVVLILFLTRGSVDQYALLFASFVAAFGTIILLALIALHRQTLIANNRRRRSKILACRLTGRGPDPRAA
jgi:hypothetical protein